MKSSEQQPGERAHERKREHPEKRFAPPAQRFDLREAAQELAAEARAGGASGGGAKGHRQKTLYRHGQATIALFALDAGANLPPHKARGGVTINVLEGRLRIRAAGETYDLPAGNLLVLASGVEHDVHAEEPSSMLLQVHLDERAPASARRL